MQYLNAKNQQLMIDKRGLSEFIDVQESYQAPSQSVLKSLKKATSGLKLNSTRNRDLEPIKNSARKLPEEAKTQTNLKTM